MGFTRPIYSIISSRITNEPRKFIQVIAGPLQVGKTTLVQQLLKAIPMPAHYASADLPTIRDLAWLEQQ